MFKEYIFFIIKLFIINILNPINYKTIVNCKDCFDSDEDLDEKGKCENEVGCKIFRVKNYIPEKSNKRFLKPCYIVSSIVTSVLVLVIIILIYFNGTSKSNLYSKE
jgi:hypothetical protein